MASNEARPIKDPSLLDSLLPIITLIVLIALSVYLYGVDATLGPLQVALFMAAVVGAAIANKNGHSWENIAQAILLLFQLPQPPHWLNLRLYRFQGAAPGAEANGGAP